MSDCQATLNIKGAQYPCDIDAPHHGWAHANKEAGAIWCSDGEAKSAQRKLKAAKDRG